MSGRGNTSGYAPTYKGHHLADNDTFTAAVAQAARDNMRALSHADPKNADSWTQERIAGLIREANRESTEAEFKHATGIEWEDVVNPDALNHSQKMLGAAGARAGFVRGSDSETKLQGTASVGEECASNAVLRAAEIAEREGKVASINSENAETLIRRMTTALSELNDSVPGTVMAYVPSTDEDALAYGSTASVNALKAGSRSGVLGFQYTAKNKKGVMTKRTATLWGPKHRQLVQKKASHKTMRSDHGFYVEGRTAPPSECPEWLLRFTNKTLNNPKLDSPVLTAHNAKVAALFGSKNMVGLYQALSVTESARAVGFAGAVRSGLRAGVSSVDELIHEGRYKRGAAAGRTLAGPRKSGNKTRKASAHLFPAKGGSCAYSAPMGYSRKVNVPGGGAVCMPPNSAAVTGAGSSRLFGSSNKPYVASILDKMSPAELREFLRQAESISLTKNASDTLDTWKSAAVAKGRPAGRSRADAIAELRSLTRNHGVAESSI